MGCKDPSVLVGLSTVGTLVAGAGPGPISCQTLPLAVATGPLVGRAGSQGG